MALVGHVDGELGGAVRHADVVVGQHEAAQFAVEGQIHGGLTEGYAVAMGQQMPFDAQGNLLGNTLMDYFLPTAVETPKWETDYTVTPSPHHPLGAKGVAESPHVGSIPCFTNAVVDAFAHLGVTHMEMPHTSWRVWKQLKELDIA